MLPNPCIITTSPGNWCELATRVIGAAVKSYIKTKGECTLMLTGGNTAKKLYHHWAIIVIPIDRDNALRRVFNQM
jgi:6-phosphogluconolactonase/glucosamine-6-phosphate isomerase/deaminase